MTKFDVNLPVRVFLFTLDQIATVLSVDETTVRAAYIYYEGRSIGGQPKSLMLARNIANPNERPDWRVAELELVRWMRLKGFRFTQRGYPLK